MKTQQEFEIKTEPLDNEQTLKVFYIKDENGFFTKQESRLFDLNLNLIKTTLMFKVSSNEPMCGGKYYKQYIYEYDPKGVNIIKNTTQLVDANGTALTERWIKTEKDENRVTEYINLIDVNNYIIAQEKRIFDQERNLLSTKPTKVLDHVVDNCNGTVTLHLNAYAEDGINLTGEMVWEDVIVDN